MTYDNNGLIYWISTLKNQEKKYLVVILRNKMKSSSISTCIKMMFIMKKNGDFVRQKFITTSNDTFFRDKNPKYNFWTKQKCYCQLQTPSLRSYIYLKYRWPFCLLKNEFLLTGWLDDRYFYAKPIKKMIWISNVFIITLETIWVQTLLVFLII